MAGTITFHNLQPCGDYPMVIAPLLPIVNSLWVLGGDLVLNLLPKIVQKARERVLFERRNASYAFWVAQMAKAGKRVCLSARKEKIGYIFFQVLKRVMFHSRWYVKRV